jgi:peptidoglycan-N-acetylglucosamine deacetylase
MTLQRRTLGAFGSGRMMLRRRTRIALTGATVLAVVGLLLAGSWRLHKSRSVQLFGELVARVDTEERVVALTFDDGPSAPHTDSILDLLRDAGVPATFFVTGSALERFPGTAQRMAAEGHELGNHSYSHDVMVLRSQRTIRREVETTDSLIRMVGGSGRIHFRPP